VRVLLDENLPHDLIGELSGHEVATVQGMGWAGVQNGELLRRASGNVDAFVTMDSNLEHQQRLADLPFGIVLVVARSNRMADLTPIVPDILAAIARIEPGRLDRVGLET
jgi:predicted nuclease of predicted toxin-antitoxin system